MRNWRLSFFIIFCFIAVASMDAIGQVPKGSQPEGKDAWDKFEKISTGLSIAAIPIVLAICGWYVQKRLQDQATKKEYVELAVSILKDSKDNSTVSELRSWAVDLLDRFSPISIPPGLSKKLRSGELNLPSLETFSPVASKELTVEKGAGFSAVLVSFRDYLHGIGLNIPRDGEIKVIVDAKRSNEFMAIFDPERNAIIVNHRSIHETNALLHAYMRHIAHKGAIDNWADKEGNADQEYWLCASIERGLAAYFVCSFIDNPVMLSKDYNDYDLTDKRELAGLPHDLASCVINGSQTWSSAFWSLRGLMGAEKADRAIAGAWVNWAPKKNLEMFREFSDAVIQGVKAIDKEHVAASARIFKKSHLS